MRDVGLDEVVRPRHVVFVQHLEDTPQSHDQGERQRERGREGWQAGRLEEKDRAREGERGGGGRFKWSSSASTDNLKVFYLLTRGLTEHVALPMSL